MTATPDPLREGLEAIREYVEGIDLFYGSDEKPDDVIDTVDGSHTSPPLRMSDLRALLAETGPAAERCDTMCVCNTAIPPASQRHLGDIRALLHLLTKRSDEMTDADWTAITSHRLRSVPIQHLEAVLAFFGNVDIPPAPHGDDTGAVEVTDAMVERALDAAMLCGREKCPLDNQEFGHEGTHARIGADHIFRVQIRAALTAALTPEES